MLNQFHYERGAIYFFYTWRVYIYGINGQIANVIHVFTITYNSCRNEGVIDHSALSHQTLRSNVSPTTAWMEFHEAITKLFSYIILEFSESL